MKHQIQDDETAIVVSFEGDVDLDHSREVRDILLDCVGRGKVVLVDLAEVSYIDSSGIASLVEALQMAKKKDCSLILVSVSEACLRVLKLARLDTVFSISENLEEAKEKAKTQLS